MDIKERPILFSGEMVRAILAGNKVQTRRVVKSQPNEDGLSKLADGPWVDTGGKEYKCPYGQIGDHLWVRETWRKWHEVDSECGCGDDYCTCGPFPPTPYCYAADFDGYIPPEYREEFGIKWRPSIHMPRWASRIPLEVKAVRVERLQDISEEDAKREGCFGYGECGGCGSCSGGDCYVPPEEEFENLWDSTNSDRPNFSWNDNPWVWVIEFEVIEPRQTAE